MSNLTFGKVNVTPGKAHNHYKNWCMMDELERQMAALSVADERRSLQRMTMPPAELVNEFDQLALEIMGRHKRGADKTRNRRMVAAFGVPALVMAKVWQLLELHDIEMAKGATKEHLLWALHYAKVYDSESNSCNTVGTLDEKTFRKWQRNFFEYVASLEEEVIVWENRKTNDKENDCLGGVDTIDVPFQQVKIPNPKKPGKMMVNKALYSKKFNGPALRYEIVTSILSSDIVWINGPYAPGDFNDLQIFRLALKHMLEDNERLEADDIYVAEAPEFIRCPACITANEEESDARKCVGGRIETLMNRVKHWNCLKKTFKGKGDMADKVNRHSKMFRFCMVITQVSMELGVGELYKVDYE